MPENPLPTRSYVFVDTETTGLDREYAQIIELGWAVDKALPAAYIVPHTLAHAESRALEINRYWERGLDKATPNTEAFSLFARASAGQILVGANVQFDANKIANRLCFEPWWHRMIDIEAYAQAVFGLPEPPGLRTIRELLTERGYVLPVPDHTARGDVLVTQAVFYILKDIADFRAAENRWPEVNQPALVGV